MAKYLDEQGLAHLVGKVKTNFSEIVTISHTIPNASDFDTIYNAIKNGKTLVFTDGNTLGEGTMQFSPLYAIASTDAGEGNGYIKLAFVQNQMINGIGSGADNNIIQYEFIRKADNTVTLNTYQLLISNGNTFEEGCEYKTSVANMDLSMKRVQMVTINANQSFSANLNKPVANGKYNHIMILNNSASAITITIPNTGRYVNNSEDNLTIQPNKYGEINVLWCKPNTSSEPTLFIRHS